MIILPRHPGSILLLLLEAGVVTVKLVRSSTGAAIVLRALQVTPAWESLEVVRPVRSSQHDTT